MRVTQSQAYRAQLQDARRKKADSAQAAHRASSGRRIDRPSDDPSGSGRALLLKAAAKDFTIGREKIDRAVAETERREAALGTITTALSRAREVAVGMANGTMSADARARAAQEVSGLRETVLYMGNTEFMGRHLFAGAQTDTAAFDLTGAYVGDSVGVSVELPGGTSTSVTADGGALLRGTGGAQSVLGALEGLIAGLQTNNITAIRTSFDEIDASIDHVIEARTQIGAEMGRVETLDQTFEAGEIALDERRAGIEEIDVIEGYSEVVRTRQAFEQALQVTAKSRTPSIFDLL